MCGRGGGGGRYGIPPWTHISPVRHLLRSSPSAWRTAAQCPPSRRTQAAIDKPQVPMWPIWKLEPPTRLRASDGGKQRKTRTARRVETEWSVSCPTALPDHADLPDSSSPRRCSGATACRSSAPVRQTEQDGSGREKTMIRRQTPQKGNIVHAACRRPPRVPFVLAQSLVGRPWSQRYQRSRRLLNL